MTKAEIRREIKRCENFLTKKDCKPMTPREEDEFMAYIARDGMPRLIRALKQLMGSTRTKSKTARRR